MLLLLLQLAAPAPVRLELPNGLRVWIQEDHRRPVALVQVTYQAGSLHEQPGQTGIAHYVEHMVYRASQHIRNEDAYGYIDRIGGRYTGGTWPEFTRYAETVPGWALESALRVTAERMCCALFDSTEFERERHNVVTEANGFADFDPLSILRDAIMYSAFETHPYRLNSNTWARDNLVVSRDDAYAWYKSYYGPNNAVLVIVGDVDVAAARSMVERHFADLPRAPKSGEITVVEPPQRAEKTVSVTAPGVQPELEVVYHAPGAHHPDFAALTVATRLLQQRLPDAMRAAGASGAVTVEDSASQYPYVLRIVARPDSSRHLERMLDVVDREVDQLANGDVAAAEIAAAGPRAADADRASAGIVPTGAIPPRRSYLTTIADELTDRESLPWEVSRAGAARARATGAGVDGQAVASFARRWLRRSQRTVGFLRAGARDDVVTWSDGRRLAGERMEIPPLTTMPARRMRPTPVPPRALEPLQPLSIAVERIALRSGSVIRVVRRGDERPLVRLECDCPDTVRLALLAHALRADTAIASRHADIRVVPPRAPSDGSPGQVARDRALRAVGASPVLHSGAFTVAIVGGAGTDRVRDRVRDHVRAIAATVPRAAPSATSVRSGDAGRATADREERIVLPDARQVAVVAALPGVSRSHPDRRALELLDYIVGVPSYGGRLGWALSKAGLTYAETATATFGARGGSILFSTECDTRNTDSVIQAIREVVAGVGERGVDAWELREAQAFMLGRATLYGAREDSDADVVAAALNQSSETGMEMLDLPALSREYLAVTPAELDRVARKYYRPELLHVVAAGAVPAVPERIFAPGTFRSLFEP